METEITGTGEALDAGTETVEIDPSDAATLDRELAERQQRDYEALTQNVENAKAKVERTEAHLEGAKEALATAEAELAAATAPQQ